MARFCWRRLAYRAQALSWMMLPPLAIAADQSGISGAGSQSWESLLMQLGIGGVVAIAAVQAMLALYKDKERGTKEYHAQILDLTRQQIKAITDTQVSLNAMADMLRAHNAEFKEVLHELRLWRNRND